MALLAAMIWPLKGHPRGIPEGTEQLFGLYGDFTLSGNFEKGSPWRYESEVLMVAAQAGRPFPPSGQSIDLAAVGNYNSLGYQLNDHHSLFIGYAFQHVLPPLSGQPTNENRAWQQYNFSLPTFLGALKLTSRLEERTVNIGPGVSYRARQQAKFIYPFDQHWSLVATEEYFVNLNTVSWGPVAGFDQNRLFVGVGYQMDSRWRSEFGYLNNYINRDIVDDRDMDFFAVEVYLDLTE